jgi:L-malate glycosyltransferase
MKVCLHVQPRSRSLGGCEVLVAHVAAMLKERHRVEVAHHREELDLARLAAFAGVALDGVTARCIERRPTYFATSSNHPVAMYREPRRWGREVAGDADVFMTFTHELPPFNPARFGVLVLLFPMSSPFETWPLADVNPDTRSVRSRLSRIFYRRRYERLWKGYGVKLAVSNFTAAWARTRWGIDCDVLYPLVDGSAADRPKEEMVLTLGRFSVSGVSKHQREMAAAFATSASRLGNWRLTSVGEARTAEEIAYAASVADGRPHVTVRTNVSHAEVRTLMASARVFWHAAGLDEDERTSPERLEHFGIATVEAMANGCVPVVIGRGGQREIVEHGRSGFLCASLEEMTTHTAELGADADLWSRMSAAARERARAFGPDAFRAGLARHAPFLGLTP